MADDIKKNVIIDLKFDVSKYVKASAEASKASAELKAKNQLLKKSWSENEAEIVKNEAEIKRLGAIQRENQKAVTNLTTANKANAGSNEQLKAQLSVMTLEYNKLSEAERNNSARGKELFTQINQTTASLKGNEEAVGNSRRSVGDYGKALQGTPFGSFISGIKATGAAFLANPIGLIIAGIVGAFALLAKAFTHNEAGANRVKKATSAVSAVFSAFLKVIEPVAEFIADSLGKAFDEMSKQIDMAAQGLETLLKLFNFNDAAKSLNEFVAGTKEAVKLGQDLADAEANLTNVKREQRVVQLQAQNDAEKQRQIRDDESLSIEERKKANEELGRILEEQSAKELAMAQKSMQVALLRQKIDGDTTEVLDEISQAKLELIDIEERITGQQSEQLVNINSLNRDAAQQAKDAAAKRKEQFKQASDEQKKQLDLFILQQGTKAKSFEEELKLAEDVSAKKLVILENERKKKLITETDYQIEFLQITQELENKKADLILQAAQRELQLFIDNNQSKLDNNQFLNDTMYQQEIDRLESIANAQRSYEAARLEQGLISQQEYNDNINLINTENQLNNEALAEEKKIADDEKKAEDEALQFEIDLQKNEDAFALQNQELQRRYQADLKAAEKTGADKLLIDKKYKAFHNQLETQQSQASLQVAGDTFGALASLMGDNADAAKAFASFQAVINATQSIISVLSATSTIPEPYGSIAKGISAAAIGVTAFKNVQKINSTPVPKVNKPPKAERGMILGGKSHRNGGVQISADGVPILEAEKGELLAIVNERNTSMLNYLSDLNSFGGNGNSFFQRGGTKTFANGGIGFGNVSTSIEQSQNGIEQFMTAIENLPTPVVAVQDINEVQYSANQVQVRANL